MSSQAELENYNLNLRRDLGRTINDRDEWRILAKRREQALDRVRELCASMDSNVTQAPAMIFTTDILRAIEG